MADNTNYLNYFKHSLLWSTAFSSVLSMDEEAVTLIGPHEPWERQLLYRRSRLETAEEPGEGSTGKLGKEKPFPALSVPPAPSGDEAYHHGIWQRRIFTKPASIITEQEGRVDLELRGNDVMNCHAY